MKIVKSSSGDKGGIELSNAELQLLRAFRAMDANFARMHLAHALLSAKEHPKYKRSQLRLIGGGRAA